MATREENEYDHNDDVFVEVSFAVVLDRRPTYYLFNIIFPTILIAFVAILSFCLPPASGEKVSLSVTSLLTQTVFMLMLSQEMPTTSETIPLLRKFTFWFLSNSFTFIFPAIIGQSTLDRTSPSDSLIS